MNILKEAAQLALDALENCGPDQSPAMGLAAAALTAALALPDAEPIGDMRENGVTWYGKNPHAHPVGTKFYTSPPPAIAPEPVRLTDAEISAAYFEALGSQHLREQDRQMVSRFASVIEAAIHAKQGGKP